MSGKHTRGRFRWGGILTIVALVTLALLASGCCVHPVYDETPTAPASPVSIPTATPPSQDAASTPVSGPTLLLMEPSVVLNFAVGETRQVQVKLQNIRGLHEIELHISFEPRTISVEDADAAAEGVQIEPGAFPTPARVVQNEANNETGFIVYHVLQEEGSSATGSGVVASFTIRALAEGGSPLQFTIVKLYNTEGQLLPEPDPIDGLVSIGGGDKAVTTTEVPSPTVPAVGGEWETAQSGETLYQVCRRHCPHRWPSATAFDADLKAYAEQVARLNGLAWPNPVISPGQRLQMPACP
jgi:hypothetical protein